MKNKKFDIYTSEFIYRLQWSHKVYKDKFAEKQTFFCAAILHPLGRKVFKSETTSFHFFSPRESKKFGVELWEVGGKHVLTE